MKFLFRPSSEFYSIIFFFTKWCLAIKNRQIKDALKLKVLLWFQIHGQSSSKINGSKSFRGVPSLQVAIE